MSTSPTYLVVSSQLATSQEFAWSGNRELVLPCTMLEFREGKNRPELDSARRCHRMSWETTTLKACQAQLWVCGVDHNRLQGLIQDGRPSWALPAVSMVSASARTAGYRRDAKLGREHDPPQEGELAPSGLSFPVRFHRPWGTGSPFRTSKLGELDGHLVWHP